MTISATSQGLKPGVCTSSNRPANPYDGMMIYETDTDSLKIWNGSAWTGVTKMRKVAAFTSSGTWTVPAGVTYAIANMIGGGSGTGSGGTNAGSGGTSSVAFASGTVSASGGISPGRTGFLGGGAFNVAAGAPNSGKGSYMLNGDGSGNNGVSGSAPDGAYIVAGATVTPAASITVTVGAGGTAGTNGAAGGSGYVWIEYEE